MSEKKTEEKGTMACPSYGSCSAPLCPRDPQSMEHGIWFADEAICAANGRGERFIAVQRKIARRTGGDRGRGYFTRGMLDALLIVGRGIRGLSPDVEDAAGAEKAWIARKLRTAPSPAAWERRREWGRKLAKGASVSLQSGPGAGKVPEAVGD